MKVWVAICDRCYEDGLADDVRVFADGEDARKHIEAHGTRGHLSIAQEMEVEGYIPEPNRFSVCEGCGDVRCSCPDAFGGGR